MARCSRCNALSFRTAGEGLCLECYGKDLRESAAQKLSDRAVSAADELRVDDLASNVLLTTETAHNLQVVARHGIVTSEYVVGMHIFRDIGASFRDFFGGRSETMQRGLKEARNEALRELRAEAAGLGANAVVGVDLDYSEISGGGKSMLFLVASGTAVTVIHQSDQANTI